MSRYLGGSPAFWMLAAVCLAGNPIHAQETVAALSSASEVDAGSYATVKGRKLYYQCSGAGQHLLLLHGGLGSSEDFQKILPALSKHFRVIAVDRFGHGRSADSGEPFTYSSMAEDMKAFLDVVGIPSAYVCGFSDGGVVGYHLASRYPQLVKKLVAIGANTRVDGMSPEIIQWVTTRMTPEILPVDLPQVAADYRRLSPHPEHFDDFVRRSRDLWLRDPYITPDEVKKIESPVLLVAGDRNDIRVEHLLELRAMMKNACLCILPDASHFVINEKPLLLRQIVTDFLLQAP